MVGQQVEGADPECLDELVGGNQLGAGIGPATRVSLGRVVDESFMRSSCGWVGLHPEGPDKPGSKGSCEWVGRLQQVEVVRSSSCKLPGKVACRVDEQVGAPFVLLAVER